MLDLPTCVTSAATDQAAWQRILDALETGRPLAERPATVLERLFAPLLADPGALLVGQIGQSLDGRIATESGHSHYVNGRSARVHLHRLRAWADAVVVGIGTILFDDPRLNVRHVPGRSPARVVIDPHGRIRHDARVLRDDGVRRLVVRMGKGAIADPCDSGVEILFVPEGPSGMAVAALFTALRERGFRRILVEGGADTLSRVLAAGALDRLHVLVAPMLIGSGLPAVTLPAVQSLDQALRPEMRAFVFDEGDVLFDCDLRPRRFSA